MTRTGSAYILLAQDDGGVRLDYRPVHMQPSRRRGRTEEFSNRRRAFRFQTDAALRASVSVRRRVREGLHMNRPVVEPNAAIIIEANKMYA